MTLSLLASLVASLCHADAAAASRALAIDANAAHQTARTIPDYDGKPPEPQLWGKASCGFRVFCCSRPRRI